VDVQRAAELYAQGWTLRQIGRELDVHWSTISQQLQSAGITMRRVGTPAHPTSTDQIAELRNEGMTWNEIAEQVDMTVSGVWSRYRRTRPPKPPRLGRWQQVLADALIKTGRSGFGRPSLIISAERRPGLSSPLRDVPHTVWPPSVVLGCFMCRDADGISADRSYLVLAKPGVIMNDIRLRRLAVAGSRAAGRKSPRNHAQIARNLRRSLRNAATGARLIQADGLDSQPAADLAAQLDEALEELHRLQRSLDRRIRRARDAM
jgi:hypothetical protein